MMNRGMATPIDANSALSAWASRSPSACWFAAMSSTDIPELASAGARWLTIRCRKCSATSSVRNCGSVPTSSWRSSGGSTTRSANPPNARSRTMPNSGSRTMIGFWVPHFKSVNCRVLKKYTSALNGELKPYFHPWSVLSTGRFCVVRV